MTAKVADTYVHPFTITGKKARVLARLCIRQGQAFALQPDGRVWQAWCPLPDKDKFTALIEEAHDV